MQAVLGRTTAAKRQAARRIAKERNKRLSNEKRTAINENHQLARMRAGIAKEARIRRKQDWELGPLAPRRDVGQSAETYGTSDQRLMQLPSVLQKNRTSRWLIKEGDRVVIVKGRDQGQIGNVTSINKASESVVVEGLNLLEVHVPEWMRKEDNDTRLTRVISSPIPAANVRLVHAYLDPKTQVKRDIIVEEAKIANFWRDPVTKRVTYHRQIEGLPSNNPVSEGYDRPDWEQIHWPKGTGNKPPKEEHDSDTLRITVDDRTFVPTLLRPPMPLSVLDELRNRYSKFRDRHDPEYVAAKEAEDVEAEARKEIPDWMLQPSQELRERAKTKEKPIKPATPDLMSEDDFLARVGELMSERPSPKELLAAKA